MYKIIKIFSLLCIPFLIIECTTGNPEVIKKNLSITHGLSIGTDSLNANTHKVFSFIVDIVTDRKGRFFVVDAKETKVRVYSEKGSFLRYIGKEGSGPGEFKEISSLFINQQNQLVVLDPDQSRATIFSLDGELISTYNLPIAGVIQIEQIPDGRYVLLGFHEEELAHVVDSNFNNIQTSFIHTSDILRTDEELEAMWIRYNPGRLVVSAQNTILFSPSIYAGSIYQYEFKKTRAWQITDTLQGFNRHKNPVTFSTYKQAERVDVPFTLPDGRFAAQFHSQSEGLFSSGEDTFMHFSIQERTADDWLDLIVEQFNKEGRLLYYSVIDSMQQPDKVVYGMHDNSIYLFDREKKPLLRVWQVSNL